MGGNHRAADHGGQNFPWKALGSPVLHLDARPPARKGFFSRGYTGASRTDNSGLTWTRVRLVGRWAGRDSSNEVGICGHDGRIDIRAARFESGARFIEGPG